MLRQTARASLPRLARGVHTTPALFVKRPQKPFDLHFAPDAHERSSKDLQFVRKSEKKALEALHSLKVGANRSFNEKYSDKFGLKPDGVQQPQLQWTKVVKQFRHGLMPGGYQRPPKPLARWEKSQIRREIAKTRAKSPALAAARDALYSANPPPEAFGMAASMLHQKPAAGRRPPRSERVREYRGRPGDPAYGIKQPASQSAIPLGGGRRQGGRERPAARTSESGASSEFVFRSLPLTAAR